MAQWHLLLGAMLANKESREQALKKIPSSDVPSAWRGLWLALASGDGSKVWESMASYGIPQPVPMTPNASVVARLMQSLQEIGLREFVKAQVSRAEFSHKAGLGADAVADTFESVAAAIRQRQAMIQNGNGQKK